MIVINLLLISLYKFSFFSEFLLVFLHRFISFSYKIFNYFIYLINTLNFIKTIELNKINRVDFIYLIRRALVCLSKFHKATH